MYLTEIFVFVVISFVVFLGVSFFAEIYNKRKDKKDLELKL